jgi:trigger factor
MDGHEVQVQVEELSPIKRKLDIVVPAAAVGREIDRAYKDLGKRVRLKGFRPGKAPRAVLEMYYKKQVDQEVADALVQKGLGEALKEKNLTAVGLNWPEPPPPLAGGEDFRFKVEIEVPPEFTAQNYKGLELVDPGAEVSDEMVAARLAEIQESNAMLQPLSDPRGIEAGDFVILDYQGFFAGEALPEAKGENVYLEVGAGKFNPEFEQQLLGLTPGAESRFAVALPQDFFNPLIAGKVIDFQVKIHEIKQKVVPPLDDAFAQSLGGNFQTVADLREAVRHDIIKVKERERQGRLEDQVIDRLITLHPFEAPPSLIRQEQENILREQLQFFQEQGINLEGLDVNKMLESMKPRAERRVRARLIFDRIALQEGITLTDDEVETTLARVAEENRRPLEQVREFYRNHHLMEGLRRQLRDEKVMRLILDAAVFEAPAPDPAQEKG